jgi:predicted small metal-binding protein
MKNIACSAIGGGDCTHVASGETEEAVVEQWHAHFKEVHPEVIADVTEEDKKNWMAKHHEIWEAAETV